MTLSKDLPGSHFPLTLQAPEDKESAVKKLPPHKGVVPEQGGEAEWERSHGKVNLYIDQFGILSLRLWDKSDPCLNPSFSTDPVL